MRIVPVAFSVARLAWHAGTCMHVAWRLRDLLLNVWLREWARRGGVGVLRTWFVNWTLRIVNDGDGKGPVLGMAEVTS